MQTTIESIFSEAAQTISRCSRDCSSAVEHAAAALIDCFERGGKLLICGNGGSAAEAQHLAAEFVNKMYVFRKALPALALTTDSSALTSIGNDISFDDIFSRQVEALGSPGDILWGLSTSGKSANIKKAFAAAKAAGLYCLAFCGRPGSDLEAQADIALSVPCEDTGRIQEIHLLAGHIICHIIEQHFKKSSRPGPGGL